MSRYRLVNDRVSLNDESGPAACLGVPGEYAFRFVGDTLQFRVLTDACNGRREALATLWFRAPAALVLRGATLIDGTGAPPRPGMTLVVQRGIIERVTPDGGAAVPEYSDVRDLGGAFVLPGLIDAHVHVATNPSGPDARARVERRLEMALRGGVVAVRDMAGDARALASLARDAALGEIRSPIIRYSALMAGPDFFTDPRVRASTAGAVVGRAPWARAIEDSTDLRQAVAEARGTGATGIKLYGSLAGPDATRIATEARRQGTQVWAHAATFPARPSEIVASGAHVVSHAPLLAWEAVPDLPGVGARQQYDPSITAAHPSIVRVLQEMRARNVVLEPTLFVFRDDPALPDTALARRRTRFAWDVTRAAYQAGVRIAAGTDGIGGETEGNLPNIHEELALLVERAGMTPMDALVAATRTNAEILGLATTHGTIAVGRTADLLVLNTDPTRDIRATRDIRFVIVRGRVLQ